MLRHFVPVALRHLSRNGLDSAISILGMSIGLCAAILMGLVVRNELSYDRFIDGYERTYLGISELAPRGHPPDYNTLTHHAIAERIKLHFSEVAAATRLAPEEVSLRRGDVEARENIFWAEPNAFEVLRLPVIAGDLSVALQRPDAIVMSRSKARKYFGQDNPLGQALQLQGAREVIVTAIIEDLPTNGTNLPTDIFVAGHASYSELARLDATPANSAANPSFEISVWTYVRLAPGATIERVQNGMSEILRALWPARPPGVDASVQLVRLDDVHLFPGLNPGLRSRLTIATAVGILILFLACVNFVNISTARSLRRAQEVGIRKVCGASRVAIVVQFLGESLVYVLLATCLAMAAVEFALPHVNAFLGTGAVFEYWRDPALLLSLVVGAALVAVLAGFYPAFVLSGFRPVSVLRGTIAHPRTSHMVRQGLVVFQFAILMVLMIAAGVVYRQQVFATKDALRVETDDVLMIESACNAAFKSELQALPGVRKVSCASGGLLNEESFTNVMLKDGTTLPLTYISVDPAAFDVFGFQPVAGRFFTTSLADECECGRPPPEGTPRRRTRWVINEAAVQRLGFPSAQAAVGQTIGKAGEIIGVVPDFSLNSVKEKIGPSVYVVSPNLFAIINVKLSGRGTLETLASIDRAWTATGATQPIKRLFLSDYFHNLYLPMTRQAQAFGIFALIALLLACLGLFGLSASSTERRAKEIGVRKAMGAGTRNILQLLVWQFTRPVVWASLLAWPAGAYLMNRWLQGFAYHVDLEARVFVLSSVTALLVAICTVATHCYLVARDRPANALRFE